MKNYKALLAHPEGDFVTDFKNKNNIQDVWDEVGNMGSRWIFYPIVFVCTDKTVIDTPDGMEFLKGKRITSLVKYLKSCWAVNADEIFEVINNGYPLSIIYF
jgi:hypothetical protein